jgi:ribonuclease-3
MISRNPYKALEKNLGYRFKNKSFLKIALTHPSFSNEYPQGEVEDNQRLEFLGDAVLGYMCASHLFKRFPGFREGRLTKTRASMANSEILATIGTSLALGEFLLLGKGEKNMGGNQRGSNITDALEAIIGAAYLDGGIKASWKIFSRLFFPHIERLISVQPLENPKGTLQEHAQQNWKVSPAYRITEESGPAHDRVYTAEVVINNEVAGIGRGASKQTAEKDAALNALAALDIEA